MWRATCRCEELEGVRYASASVGRKVWLQGRPPFLNKARHDKLDLGYEGATISLPTVDTGSPPIEAKVVKLYDNARAVRLYNAGDMRNQNAQYLPAIVFEIRPPHELDVNFRVPSSERTPPAPFRFANACSLANSIFALYDSGYFHDGGTGASAIKGFFGENGTFDEPPGDLACMCADVKASGSSHFYPIENFVGTDAESVRRRAVTEDEASAERGFVEAHAGRAKEARTNPTHARRRIFDDRFKPRLQKFVDDCVALARAGKLFQGYDEPQEVAPYFWFTVSNGSELGVSSEGDSIPTSAFEDLNDVVREATAYAPGEGDEDDVHGLRSAGSLWNSHRMLQYIRFPFMERSYKHRVQFECPAAPSSDAKAAAAFDPVTDPVYKLEADYADPKEMIYYFDWGKLKSGLCKEAKYERMNPKPMQSTLPYFERTSNANGKPGFRFDLDRTSMAAPPDAGWPVDTFNIYGPYGIRKRAGLAVLLFVATPAGARGGGARGTLVELSIRREPAIDQRMVVDVQPGDVLLLRPETRVRFLHRTADDLNETCILRINLYMLRSSSKERAPHLELGLRWRKAEAEPVSGRQLAPDNPRLRSRLIDALEKGALTDGVVTFDRLEWASFGIRDFDLRTYVRVEFRGQTCFFHPTVDSAAACYTYYDLRKRFGVDGEPRFALRPDGTCPPKGAAEELIFKFRHLQRGAAASEDERRSAGRQPDQTQEVHAEEPERKRKRVEK